MDGVIFSFDFVNHEWSEDIKGIRAEISKNDLLIIENVGRTKESQDYFNEVSNGKIDDKNINSLTTNLYFKRFLLEISGTNKPVRFVDIPRTWFYYPNQKYFPDSSTAGKMG